MGNDCIEIETYLIWLSQKQIYIYRLTSLYMYMINFTITPFLYYHGCEVHYKMWIEFEWNNFFSNIKCQNVILLNRYIYIPVYICFKATKLSMDSEWLFFISENVVPVKIRAPKLQFLYSDVSSMSMECSVQDASVYGVQYWVTWSVNGQQRSRKLMGPGVYSSTLPLSTQDFNSLSSKVFCRLKLSPKKR